MRALITGANGFIGSQLARRLLESGDDVTAMVRPNSRLDTLESLDVRRVHGDVRDLATLPAAIDNVDVVYHLAGLTKARSTAHFLAINEEGVRNVAAACAARTTPPTLVLVSSLAAAGPAINGRPRTEFDPPTPVSNYGRSKLAGEQAARSFADRVPVTIVRPPLVFGPGDRDSMNMIRPVAKLNLHVVPGLSESQFSMIYVQDLAAGLRESARRGSRLSGDAAVCDGAGVYYLADEESISFATIGRMIARALDKRHLLVLRLPIWMVRGFAAVNETGAQLLGKYTILNVDKIREAAAGSWTCSPAKAKSELGFATSAPLAEHFDATARWLVEHGWV